MSEQWFVRVQGREYGPVDLGTLREWQAEGRLIPANEVRGAAESEWRTAAQIPGLFAPPPLPRAPDPLLRRRTFGEIIGETFRIYARGFSVFVRLALLVAVPSCLLKLSFAFVTIPEQGRPTIQSIVGVMVGAAMLALVLAAWPIFVAGLQFATAALAAGRRIRFGEILASARTHWGRVARLAIVVYGNYLFWTVLPLFALLALAAQPTVLSVLLALVALAFQVYMAGRLFINFMFWQQSCTLGGLEMVDALRESKQLARSRTAPSWLERPLFRGAMLASLWLLVLLALSAAVELPFVLVRLRGVTTLEEALAVIRAVSSAPAPDAMTIASYVLSDLMHALIRPLLGIAFVLLYYDARARSQTPPL